MKESRVVFHGVNDKKVADIILKEGFKKGTYFARHLEDAICYGGRFVFYVVIKTSVKYWEIISESKIPPERIKQLVDFRPKELYYNERATIGYFSKREKCPCSNCGADIGDIRLSVLGNPVVAKCKKCGKKIN